MSLIIPTSEIQVYEVPNHEGVELHYRNPSSPEVHALYKKHTANGVKNPEIFGEGKQDENMMIIFGFEAAAMFLTGWKGIVTMEGKQEVPVVFHPNRIGLLPDMVLANFAQDVIFKYMARVELGGGGLEQEDNPIPN